MFEILCLYFSLGDDIVCGVRLKKGVNDFLSWQQHPLRDSQGSLVLHIHFRRQNGGRRLSLEEFYTLRGGVIVNSSWITRLFIYGEKL